MVEMVETGSQDTVPIRRNTVVEENVRASVPADLSDREMPLSFVTERHLEPIEGISCITQTWRMKERMKTVSVALVLCLNVGVDPPDIVKTQPCARLECWIDPMSMPPAKALESIGAALQTQYERWQPRARYRQSLDPTAEDVKKLCSSLRRNAKEERMLFHYNGHGVPKPTTNGEIWVFNRTYTQYIPLSIYDLQTWMGAPSIYVYDCSNAGIIVESFKTFASQHESEYDQANSQSRNVGAAAAIPPPCYRNCIQLAACAKNQVLPMNPELPADLFTACLTTPIKIALKWYVLQYTSKLVPKVTLDLVDKIPGKITDRRTMLGELNWIFTAITDTIAWNTLPRDLFQKLFRQDLLVASLFRNFLLAQRIMRSCDCTPISSPELPSTYQHPMWSAWDLALDLSLGQLPAILNHCEPFQHLPFFEEQLTAFQVWLELGSENRTAPEQLPIVLQVLLSQVHRMRALELLGKFLDLGPWAVNLALSVGIFPYVLKLLQSCAKELRPLLIFIWAKILAVDKTCQADLVRDSGHKYFLSVLQDLHVTNECRTQAVFVLACIVNEFRDGQEAALQGSLISICLEQLNDSSPQLRQWVAICLGRLWDQYEKARWTGVRDNAHEKLYILLHDPCPEVRAAAVYALGTFINSVAERSEHANTIDHSIVMTLVNNVNGDMSSLVRKELVKALQWFVLVFEHAFWNVANFQESNVSQQQDVTRTPTGMGRVASRDRLKPSPGSNQMSDSNDFTESIRRAGSVSCLQTTGLNTSLGSHSGSLGTLPGLAYGSVYMKIWRALCYLETDPHPDVSRMCTIITGYVRKHSKDYNNGPKDSGLGISSSLPPSPKGGSFITSDSPPSLHYTPKSSTLNRRRMQHRIAEENEDKEQNLRKPLVTTHFVEWSCKKFAEPMMRSKIEDIESMTYYEKEYRYLRNKRVRKEAAEERKKVATRRLEHHIFTGKVSTVPSILQFHPFDQQIAIAERDSFSILDWGRGAKVTQCQYKSAKNPKARITAIQWINGHDIGLVLTGADDGSVKLWRMPNAGSKDMILITAWQAFTDMGPPLFKSSMDVGFPGVVLAWEQYTQTVISSGETRVIRFWDAERELRAFDIPTGADASVTCIDSTFTSVSHENLASHISVCKELHEKDKDDEDDNDDIGDDDDHDDDADNDDDDDNDNDDEEDGLKMADVGGQRSGENERNLKMGLVVCGCSDGSVRLYDRRCNPNEAKVRTWMEHGASVMGLQLRGCEVISASCQGDVCLYDIRQSDAIYKVTVFPTHMSAFAAHRGSDIYACGSANQYVNIYSISRGNVNSIRYYEGFMGYRVGSISSLAFHPSRVVLATGTTDGTVNFYGLENRR